MSVDAIGALSANPVSYLPSVAFKNTIDFGAPNGSAYFLNTIGMVPGIVGNWHIINRAIIPVIDVSGFIAGTPDIPVGAPGDGASGLGDINYSSFFSPAKKANVDWGIGPSFNFPSATDDQLGSGKWSAGPTAAFFYFNAPWAGSVLGRQLWSYAGDDDRADVNQFLLQNVVLYGLGNGWSLVSDLTVTANWDAASGNRWTVPLGGGIGRLFNIGSQWAMARIQASYYVVRPDAAPDWAMNFTIRFMFPK